MVSELEKLVKAYQKNEKKANQLSDASDKIWNENYKIIEKKIKKFLLADKKLPKTISVKVGGIKVWMPVFTGCLRISKPKK